MRGESASRHRCGCRVNATSSCCRQVYALGKARKKYVIANGIALFREISSDNRQNYASYSRAAIEERVSEDQALTLLRTASDLSKWIAHEHGHHQDGALRCI